MKNLFVSVMFFFVTLTLFSQSNSFIDLQPDSVLRQNPRLASLNYVPGEIIVRFLDETKISLTKSNGSTLTGVASLDQLVSKWKVTEIKPLFDGAEPLKSKQMMETFNGKMIERPSLHNIYLLKAEIVYHELSEAINDFKENGNVLYAEPNFIVSISDTEPLSPPLNEDEMIQWLEEQDLKNDKQITTVTPNDPLFSQQWGIPATQIDQVWSTTTGTEDQVIAILDTGVDWNHPDLTENIWNNSDESLDGADSDGNGFVDDVRGWDFVNNDNNPADDNSHGTHVAGIAAAKGNNGIGIAGVNWAAKIMPVKVFQSSGQGNMATIVQGINYAAQNGATVINMSFGTYARSLALEDALANAYATAVLVAAAGNDGLCIGPARCFDFRYGLPSFPGALSFVLGVETLPLPPQGYTNFDSDGPYMSVYSELFNYELKAPGSEIVSTIPNGGYRIYTGTSMAAPLISGAVSLYKTIRPNESQELMWGNYIETLNPYLQIKDAIEIVPVPRLWISSYYVIDTLTGDGSGTPDSGESIQLITSVKNFWGQASNVNVKLSLGEFENPEVAQILNSVSTITSISPYGTGTNENNPFVVNIAGDLINGREIVFMISAWNEGIPDTVYHSFVLNVTNAIKVNGLITDSVVWNSNRIYYVNENLRIAETGKLCIMPGTNIMFADGKSIDIRGKIVANGLPNQLINFFGENSPLSFCGITSASGAGEVHINYCMFSNLVDVLRIETSANVQIENSIFSDCKGQMLLGFYTTSNSFKKSVSSNNLRFQISQRISGNISNNVITNNFDSFSPLQMTIIGNGDVLFTNNSIFENYLQNELTNISILGPASFSYLNNNYWGTIDSVKIQHSILDFYFNSSYPLAIFSPFLSIPSEISHGHVWKVLVNGADAQDEFVEPVGVGQQRFDVYFNRPMDPAYPPQVSFGVRAPYTQQAVAENGSWSADYKVYSVYKTIQLYTGDGINTVRVSGAKDLEGFEIPVEDSRFTFLINAAGSASTDFTAAPGIGKVDLEWTYPEDLPTLLGFNIYRFHHLTDTTFSDTTLVNNVLINDTLFTDFAVLPHEKYYYMYKIVRTDFTESAFSKVVNATVLTASPGDANGDLAVNVLDITTIIAHMMNQNPTPFIGEAADINADGTINVLDIIGVVNVIMGNTKMMHISQPGHIYLKQDRIDFKSDGSLSGLQFQLISPKIEALVLNKLPEGFEFIHFTNGDTLTGILFSMGNKTLANERVTLFEISDHPGTLQFGEVFAGNYAGKHVTVFKDDDPIAEDYRYKAVIQPNPTNEFINLGLTTPEDAHFLLGIYDLFGRKITQHSIERLTKGSSLHHFSKQELGLNQGVYIFMIDIVPASPIEIPWSKEIKVIVF